MRIPILLSYPKPHLAMQEAFITKLETCLRGRGLEPRTLGVTDYDMDSPLKAIGRLTLESNGLVTVAFGRTLIADGSSRPSADVPRLREAVIRDLWLTSPFCQIEPAMACQFGLPSLTVREQGVRQEGHLEKGVVGTYMPESSIDHEALDYLESLELRDPIGRWEGFVRAVVGKKGNPPQLF